MKNNQKRNDERLKKKAQKIAIRIRKKLYSSGSNEIVINSICFKLMCGCNKYLERKVKEYIVGESGLKLMKEVFEYYFLGGILKFRKKRYIIRY